MRSIAKIWFLERIDAERIARIVWRMALILLGLQMIVDVVTAILLVFFTDRSTQHIEFTILTLAFKALTSAGIAILELLLVRFVIEIGLRLLNAQKA